MILTTTQYILIAMAVLGLAAVIVFTLLHRMTQLRITYLVDKLRDHQTVLDAYHKNASRRIDDLCNELNKLVDTEIPDTELRIDELTDLVHEIRSVIPNDHDGRLSLLPKESDVRYLQDAQDKTSERVHHLRDNQERLEATHDNVVALNDDVSLLQEEVSDQMWVIDDLDRQIRKIRKKLKKGDCA